MMKRFLASFLGSLAALWVTIALLVFFGIFMLIVSLVSSTNSPGTAVKPHTVLTINLEGEVTDRPSPRDVLAELTGRDVVQPLPLDHLLASIRNAADDENIDGISLDCGTFSAGMAQMQAIINTLNEFRKSGKWVYAYADEISQPGYIIAASAADSVIVNPICMLDIHGLSSTVLYYKDLLDKIGVEAQVVKVGTYKSAVEPFLLNEMSEANREQIKAFIGSIWSTLSEQVAAGRKVPVDSVNSWADNYTYVKPGEWLVAQGLVDTLMYRHEYSELLGRATEAKKVTKPHTIDFEKYYTAAGLEKTKKRDTQIAVLYAVGDITEDGDDGIASSRLVPQILKLAEDDDVDGIVLRVNSGGGSAYASEQIWEAFQNYKKLTDKPFYVSMGDVAASGGYYISCGADRIYADKVTLTGSIGIFGIIPSAQKLLNDKLGVHSATVATNITQQLTLLEPMTERTRAAMQSYVNNGYELFIRRVAEGRKMSQDSVKTIAEGRVWDGLTAQKIGLVDRLGGLELAVKDMAETLGVGEDEYYVKTYPDVRFKWWEQVLEQSGQLGAAKMEQKLGALAPLYRTAVSVSKIDDPLQCRMDFMVIE